MIVTPERAVVGLLLNHPDLWATIESYGLRAGDFESPDVWRIYRRALDVAHSGGAVDLVTVLGGSDRLDASLASECMDLLPDPKALPEYVDAMLGQGVKRQAADLARTIEESDPREVLERMRSFVDRHSRFRRSGGPGWDESVESVVDDVLSKRHLDSMVPTGIDGLDRLLVGLRPGTVVIIAARPGVGKTALACNMAMSQVRSGIPAGIVSLEMSRYELILRQLAALSGISQYGLQTGVFPQDQKPKLREAEVELKGLPLHIVDDCPSTFSGVAGAATDLVRHEGCRVVYIDYLQLMRGEGRTASREQEVAGISRRIKELSRELSVPIVALSQLSRKTEGRSDKRPELSDLRESGALEQDADVVMFIYREDYYDHALADSTTELLVSKNRHGAPGMIPLKFDAARSRFVEA